MFELERQLEEAPEDEEELEENEYQPHFPSDDDEEDDGIVYEPSLKRKSSIIQGKIFSNIFWNTFLTYFLFGVT